MLYKRSFSQTEVTEIDESNIVDSNGLITKLTGLNGLICIQN